MSTEVKIYYNQWYGKHKDIYSCDGELDFGDVYWKGELKDAYWIQICNTVLNTIPMDKDYFEINFCGRRNKVVRDQFEGGIEYNLVTAKELKKLIEDDLLNESDDWETKANLAFIMEMPDELICMISIL